MKKSLKSLHKCGCENTCSVLSHKDPIVILLADALGAWLRTNASLDPCYLPGDVYQALISPGIWPLLQRLAKKGHVG